MKTCRHFRFQIPREKADELRDADPEPCEVCDSMPHRRRLHASVQSQYLSSIPKNPANRRERWLKFPRLLKWSA